MGITTADTTHLIIGKGEVGTSLYKVLKPRYRTTIRDMQGGSEGHVDVLHVCYPPSTSFVRATKKYIKGYTPQLVIIHSTVPVGTTKKVGTIAVHSPIRGIHPNLDKGIKIFVKYFGGKKAREAARIFSSLGVKTKVFKSAETTELAKILSTTNYAWQIIFCKEAKRICKKYRVDFDEAYTIFTKDYNEGYQKLNKPNVTRPILKPISGKIGGHCVIPNCDLLDDWITQVIKERNKRY